MSTTNLLTRFKTLPRRNVEVCSTAVHCQCTHCLQQSSRHDASESPRLSSTTTKTPSDSHQNERQSQEWFGDVDLEMLSYQK